MRMLFAAVVETSRRVSETSRRLEKIDLLAALLRQLDPEEVEIVVAFLSGYTRQGRIGIGYATLRARAALESGAAGLARYDIQLFRPVQPMLAQTSDDVAAAVSELGEAALEFKVDGARVQVHRSGDEVQIFSRALNNVTAAVPEI